MPKREKIETNKQIASVFLIKKLRFIRREKEFNWKTGGAKSYESNSNKQRELALLAEINFNAYFSYAKYK